MHLAPDHLASFRAIFAAILDPDAEIDGSARSHLRLLTLISKTLARDGASMPPKTVRAINDAVPGVLATISFSDGAAAVLQEPKAFNRMLIAKREIYRLKTMGT